MLTCSHEDRPRTGGPVGDQAFYYLHLPKTAGTTLNEEVIYRQYAVEPHAVSPDGLVHGGVLYYPGDGFFKSRRPTIPENVVRDLVECPVRAVVGHFTFGLHQVAPGRGWQYMTIVREPVARVWSMYRHLQVWATPGMRFGDARAAFDKDVSMEEMLSRFRLRELDNDQTRRIAGREPAYGRCTRELLDLALTNLEESFSLVGVTERFDETLALAEVELGWRDAHEYWVINVNDAYPATEPVDPATAEAIRAYNALDVELYEFARELMDRMIARHPSFERHFAEFSARRRAWIRNIEDSGDVT